MLDIYTLGDEVLREKTTRVTEFDNALALLVDAMFDTMVEADGIGLAAPQVGVSKRLFVIDTRQEHQKYVFINPEILQMSPEEGSHEEGCLSIPGVYADVIRPLEITIQAQDLKGKAFTLHADGLLARAIQHELDHLNGVLFIDRLEQTTQQEVIKAYNRLHKIKK
ncbi:MAG: peptide deformylase [Sphaerochaetaceae bacterium]|jgi:peptide deformylase